MHCGNMMDPLEGSWSYIEPGRERERQTDVPNISDVCQIDTLFEGTHQLTGIINFLSSGDRMAITRSSCLVGPRFEYQGDIPRFVRHFSVIR
jgi:hypothetical protein